MARRKKRRRGISAGTITVLSLCALTFVMGSYIYTRLSGDAGQLLINPSLLAEPLSVIARSVTDTEPSLPDAQSAGQQLTEGALAPSATPSPTPAPTVPPTRNFSLTAVGQINAGTELRAAAKDSASGTLSFTSMLAPVASVLPSNLSIATLRTTMTDDPAQYEAYRAPVSLAEALRSSGITLFSLATDRLLDFGPSGVQATRSLLRNADIKAAGAYITQEERDTYSIATFNGLKIGLLAYTGSISNAGKQSAGGAEIDLATRTLSAEAATKDIRAIREKGADVVVVLAHWGNRSDTKPSKETRALADAMVEAGADIILGTNPTQVQELERRTVTDAGGKTREVFIAYSLGNFLIDDSRETANITGMILHLDLSWDTQRESLSVADSWYMPTWIMRWKDTAGINRYRVVPAGASSIPEGMTDGVYVNMKNAYQSIITRIGTEAARPRAE